MKFFGLTLLFFVGSLAFAGVGSNNTSVAQVKWVAVDSAGQDLPTEVQDVAVLDATTYKLIGTYKADGSAFLIPAKQVQLEMRIGTLSKDAVASRLTLVRDGKVVYSQFLRLIDGYGFRGINTAGIPF